VEALLLSMLPTVLPLVLAYLANRLKLLPLDTSPPGGAADKELTDVLNWAIKVESGAIKLDDHDRATLPLVQAALARIAPPQPPK
jgi:hypothetical protein